MVSHAPLEDELHFFAGDEIALACVCRPKPGGHCVASIFAIKRRATATYDFFVSGADDLRAKRNVDWNTVKAMAADFKASAAEMPGGAVWEDVDLSNTLSVPEQVAAMKEAGVPMRFESAQEEEIL